MRRFLPLAVAVGAVLTASSAFAQAGGAAAGDKPTGQVGGFAASSPSIQDQDLLQSLATGQRGVQVRTNLLSAGSLQAGSTVDYWPNAAHPETPAIASRRDQSAPVQLGGFVGYLFHDQGTGAAPSTLGLDVQVATDPLADRSGWLLQPGVGYTTPLTPSWQLNTRLFSTYAPEGSAGSALGADSPVAMRFGNSADSGFQDVGVGLGLGYSITDSWNIQTQARYQRMLGAGETESARETSPHQFFGGVMIDYKF
jgi:MltA-interacting protein MipA